MTGATREIARWAVAAHPLPPDVAHAARRLVVDYLAAVVAGAAEPVPAAVRRHVRASHPGAQATAVGGGPAAAPGAAMANGTAAHALELDDGYTPGASHPSSATIPAVLALAEWRRADPDRTLAAIAVAVEVACRVAAAAHPATWRRGFHNTPLAGVFGAAAGCAALLDLPAAGAASALGLAGSHAGGLSEFLLDGSPVKRLHAGMAARDGLLSALLAAEGIDGPPTVLEGPQGYFAAFAQGDWDPGVLLGGLGEEWAMRRTSVKPYPCCRHVHGAVDAVLRLREEHGLRAETVTGVDVATYAVAATYDGTDAGTLLGAQMSMPYAVAAALCDGELGLAQFSAERRGGADVARLVPAVRVRADADLDRLYPALRPADVRISRTGGPDLRLRVDEPYGEPGNPLDDDALDAKFRALCGPVLGASRAERVLRAARAFTDLGPLTHGLATLGGQA
ncbi:MmgE/PrpD family protein [Actinomadura chibensis]|uniref:MmgE/PrpD family protein n=1 Tax=Actinomadura chibensis TaxID=392828 RepID=A0A5D0NDL4_9ACTN|nr:MmgE/PrpD family protein [Actinomadura chibensis]TYB42452.1 MmgE/PrpD family protein [Actinomadura chibensis]